jgi:coenzyme F420-reducing hydrogenase beta subunit
MLLSPNACFFVTAETPLISPGVYRVILDDPVRGVIVAAHIMDDRQEPPRRGGRKKKTPQDRRTTDKKPPAPLVGDLKWVPREELRELWDERQARDFEILRPKPR